MARKTKRKRVNWIEKYTDSFWIDGDIVAGMVGERSSVATWMVDQLFEDLQAKKIKVIKGDGVIAYRRQNSGSK